jgi:hypothetical protein
MSGGLTKGEKEVDDENGRLDGRLPKVLHVGSLAMSETYIPLFTHVRDILQWDQYHIILTKFQPTCPKLFRENFACQVVQDMFNRRFSCNQ